VVEVAEEVAEELRSADVAFDVVPEVPNGHSDVPDTPTIIVEATPRRRGAILSARIARTMDSWKSVEGRAHLKRLVPPWMWAGLNVLAILLVAQAFMLGEVDSSAINYVVNPLFQAFAGAQPDMFNVPGPIPQPVHTEAAFVVTMLPYARHASQTLGWPVSVILAQWGVEHGWTLPDFDGWNVGNTKAFNSPTGVCYGAPVVRSFCAPKTPGAGLAIYIHGAQLHYYTGIAAAARQGGPDAAARALGQSPWDAGHYTTDNSPGDSLLRAMKAFNLYRYDAP
jgi:hypothetical protein